MDDIIFNTYIMHNTYIMYNTYIMKIIYNIFVYYNIIEDNAKYYVPKSNIDRIKLCVNRTNNFKLCAKNMNEN